ncbi:MAG TPA: CDP-alcohol phosphatidyltransferase family protein [Polyangiaceae bacterium]|nr:CDP-alcohol phosphatidyltransferase family protein [Polyangiaceae bacterium]
MAKVRAEYRWQDLCLPPAWLSLSRIPLAVGFALLVDRPFAALVVLVLAGLSDVLDGWTARRFRMVTITGAALDPITDKLFVLTVALTLVVSRHLSPMAVVMLSTREIGELPLVIWLAASHGARLARAEQAMANGLGKLATALQFVAVAWALFAGQGLDAWLWATAAVGTIAALNYWRRALLPADKQDHP